MLGRSMSSADFNAIDSSRTDVDGTAGRRIDTVPPLRSARRAAGTNAGPARR